MESNTDFRADLYEEYVSGFKKSDPLLSQRVKRNWQLHFEYKLFPGIEDLPRESQILELGCGAGNLLECLARKGFTNARGVDISGQQIALAQQIGVNAEVGDAVEALLDFSAELDVIFALDFLEHFTKDELMKLVPLLIRALKIGGRLIVQVPNAAGLFPHQVMYDDLTHMTAFTPVSLAQLLERFGFSELRFLETGPIPKGVVGRVRYLGWRMISLFANLMRRIETGKTQAIWTENLVCYATLTISRKSTSNNEIRQSPRKLVSFKSGIF